MSEPKVLREWTDKEGRQYRLVDWGESVIEQQALDSGYWYSWREISKDRIHQLAAAIGIDSDKYKPLLRYLAESIYDESIQLYELQRLLIDCGVLEGREVTKPCCDECNCCNFPQTCYRMAGWLRKDGDKG